MGALKFLLVLAFFSILVIGASFLWPRLTSVPRPAVLSTVHNVVSRTPQGVTIASVLGVSNEESIQPISLSSLAQQAVHSSVSSVGSYASHIVIREATRQLENQVSKMTPDQKQILEQMICSPSESSISSQLIVEE